MILAIDPGYNNYGCVVFNENEEPVKLVTFQTKPSKYKLKRVADDDVQRIQFLSHQLNTLLYNYPITGVVGELPPSNSLSAKGAKGLSFAIGLSVALFTTRKLPVEWATPSEVKYALTSKNNASKEDMMEAACIKYNWNITHKPIYSKNSKTLIRTDTIYWPQKYQMGKGEFEHIADAIGVYHALKHTNVVLNQKR